MLLLLACVVLGIGFGLLLHKLFGKTGNEQTLAKENQQLKNDFERYQGQVNDHFSTSAELFERVSDDYRRLLGHMAEGTNKLDIELPERLLADFAVAPTPLKVLAEASEKPTQSDDQTAENSTDTNETAETANEPVDESPSNESPSNESPTSETLQVAESIHAVSTPANDLPAETTSSGDETEPDAKPT